MIAHLPDLCLPAGSGPFPLVVYIHGGGWATGHQRNSCCLPDYLKPRGIAVTSINYRLSSDAIFPAQIQDCKPAVRFLRVNASKYRLDPENARMFAEAPTRTGCL
ncbi:MAG: alpha/beta hydrolase [Bryobacterales bacterium]|nr:alpha/beta hydrolase [Bryobacterales bacterium]